MTKLEGIDRVADKVTTGVDRILDRILDRVLDRVLDKACSAIKEAKKQKREVIFQNRRRIDTLNAPEEENSENESCHGNICRCAHDEYCSDLWQLYVGSLDDKEGKV